MDLPSKAMSGDVFAVSLSLILFYFAIILINRLTDIIILFLKKVILLVIVSLAFYQFVILFMERFNAEGATTDVILFGGFGLLVGCIALIIAFHAAFSSLRKVKLKKTDEVEKEPEVKEDLEKTTDNDRILSINALKKDRGLGVVIAYLIVAEFGVISSKTVAAPTVTTGIIFFFAFMVTALFFVHQSYSNPNTGIRHFIVAFVLGGFLSIILGIFWGGYTTSMILSEAYFISDSLVAFVTGIAVSLFMGSRG